MTESKDDATAPRKGRGFGSIQRTAHAWRRLSPFFAASRHRIVTISVVAVIAGLTEAVLLAMIAALALVLSQGGDRVLVSLGPLDIDSSLRVAFLVAVGLAVVRGALQLWLAYLPAVISAMAMVGLRRRLFDAFVRTTWEVKSAERDGQFQTYMTVHVNATTQTIIMIGSAITQMFMFMTLLAAAIAMSPVAAAVLASASLVLFFALRPLARRLRMHARALSAENVEYAKGVQQAAAVAEEMQVFGASDAYLTGFYGLLEKVRRPLLRSRYLAGAVPSLYQSVALLVLVLALAAVSTMDATRIATLGAVVLMLVRAMSYGQRVQYSITGIDEKVPFLLHLADAIEEYESNPQTDGGEPMGQVERIGMRDVKFAYVPGNDVLHGIDFEVERGEVIGIVGPSGAGKSSLVQILLRLREPTSGQFVIDGRNAWNLSRREWQQSVAYVPQSPQLIWGSVADNIRFYREGISDQEVERAARLAGIHTEVESWSDGYETVVGNRAGGVSGGQRQRLCLARALVGDPQILVLDEPTSALDLRSEELVQESLRQIRGRHTVFLVAHRLSTLSVCDRVMVVQDGRIEAFDEPARVHAASEFFQEVHAISLRQTSGVGIGLTP